MPERSRKSWPALEDCGTRGGLAIFPYFLQFGMSLLRPSDAAITLEMKSAFGRGPICRFE
jgi:hypothetical protein